jgi:hypothetical protein
VDATDDGATDDPRQRPAAPKLETGGASSPAGALLAAALALPGIVPGAACAQSMPDRGIVAAKYLDYRDWQPGARRIVVTSPSLYVLAPLSDSLALEASIVHDAISGASPLFHSTLSGASGVGVHDYRKAGDVKVTKYADNWAIGVGAAVSTERDYLSRAASLDVRYSTDDRNRTYAFGIGGASDRIDSENGVAVGEKRHTIDLLVGVTQALSADAIVQSNLTYSTGHGYYSDPYKPLDTRPDSRRVLAWLTRFNQYVPAHDAVLKLSYRYLHDSFGVDSHALEASWRQPLPAGFALTPSLRYYMQSAADFYRDPPFGEGFTFGSPYTADTRLSAFGALTPALRIDKAFADGWSFDLTFAFYRQRSAWRLGGGGSPGLEPFSARWIEAGVAKTF